MTTEAIFTALEDAGISQDFDEMNATGPRVRSPWPAAIVQRVFFTQKTNAE